MTKERVRILFITNKKDKISFDKTFKCIEKVCNITEDEAKIMWDGINI